MISLKRPTLMAQTVPVSLRRCLYLFDVLLEEFECQLLMEPDLPLLPLLVHSAVMI